MALLLGALTLATSAGAAPYTDQPGIAASTQNPAVGSSLTVSGDGFLSGEQVDLTLHSAVYDLGSATADGTGQFSTAVTLPAGVSGTHTIVAVGQTSGRTASLQITIGTTVAVGSSSGGSGSGLPNTGAAVIGVGSAGALCLLIGGLALLLGSRRKTTS